jgi:hypothetical protein
MDKNTKLIISAHALQRMFERYIDPAVIEKAITFGEEIKSYPDDKPYPSRLVLYFVNERTYTHCFFI